MYYFTHICCKKDTQQDHTTTKLAAAATSYVYPTIHSGKTILLVVEQTLEKFLE